MDRTGGARMAATAVAAGGRARVVTMAAAVLSLVVLSLPLASVRASSELPAPIRIDAQTADVHLAATSMAADAGLDEGIHFVDLRLVTRMDVRVRLVSVADIVFAADPRICLVGPYWNPLDAGLSDRCWGEPDLGHAIADHLSRDAAGHALLRADEPVEVALTIERGSERCDYPPGDWTIELAIEPLLDGVSGERVYLPDTSLDVPYDPTEVLQDLGTRDRRFCSYAQTIFLQQGEPTSQP